MRSVELMKGNVETIGPGTLVRDAARIMRDKSIGFLPVVDADNHVLGTLTDRDIAIRCLAGDERDPGGIHAEDVMTREVVSCHPEDDMETCQELMSQHLKTRLMVVDDDERLAGVISLSDIAQHDRSGEVGNTLRQVTSREVK